MFCFMASSSEELWDFHGFQNFKPCGHFLRRRVFAILFQRELGGVELFLQFQGGAQGGVGIWRSSPAVGSSARNEKGRQDEQRDEAQAEQDSVSGMKN